MSDITKPSTTAPAGQAGAVQAKWQTHWGAVYFFPLYAAVPLDKRALEARMWLER